jgi:hypothetical protein
MNSLHRFYGNQSTIPSIFEQLAEKIEQGPTCQLWTGLRDKDNYGQISYRGKFWRTHRLVYTLFVGRIPKGKIVMHTCDTPACVSLEHLKLGTQKDNIQDRDKKDRGARPFLGKHHSKETRRKISGTRKKQGSPWMFGNQNWKGRRA